MRLTKSILTILLVCFAVSLANAQNISDIDFKNIRVDDLSDQQIQRIYDAAQSRNLSIDQAVQMAVARGLPQSQASKLKRRLQQVGSGGALDSESAEGVSGQLRRPVATEGPDSTKFDSLYAQTDSLRWARQQLKNKIFGYKLFTSDQVTFEPALNIPTPEDYQLGPGDEIIIDIWGAAQMNYQLEISPEGTINIDNIGPIQVNGLTVEEASNRLRSRLGDIYSGLNPPNNENKDTYMQLSLGQVRSIKVTVLGEATVPGTYTLSSLSTVFNALYAAGGPTTTGSFRTINVIRGNETVATFDLYDLLIYGNQSENIRLRSQDIIQIQPYENRVEIEGEVKRPGIYELKGNETLQDLVVYAGNFTDEAYTDRIKVIGNTPKQKQITDVKKGYYDDYILRNGDSVTVGEILDRFTNKVEIRGAVFRPGEYALEDTTSLYSLIQRADGLMGDAFMNRGIIYRTRDDYTIESISFSVRELMQNPRANDIVLQKDDVVRISSIFDLREDFTVSIKGPVQQPDTYEFAHGMTLEDLIFMADGFLQSATPYRIEVARRIRDIEERSGNESFIADIHTFSVDENLRLNEKGANFELQPFDQVYIRELPNYERQKEVYVVGEVKYPGKYAISSRDERLSDMIERAGGLTPDAYTDGATLFRKREFTQQEAQQTTNGAENGMGAAVEEGEQVRLAQRQESAQIGIELPEVLQNPGSRYDLLLEEGDSLLIPQQLETVTVEGGVFHPTTVRFESGRSFKDYITAAGGFNDLARKKRSYIIYANGDVDRTKKILFFKNYPSVEPGATIVVPEEEPTEGMSAAERIGILSTVASTMAVIATTIIRITNN
ncbi:protein involved in polysaccharide export, contains SLBB domain of the beta-grasp fold [Fodinibius roseus]|uniref:Protein involved in polysaccharide export, contains SLBB domain of the beta-grasp fold n=1 Tax=Fodinibius roseus TaxID=1194090 RepID=A0A1M4VA81_9BACT|nr:SLBB domain-containing protein [Fodinibius roseus]SHE65787.1 protein involved in polysaccharide export, contains SLBB domain of the beta-grasp fold [Fodinibius roseus]